MKFSYLHIYNFVAWLFLQEAKKLRVIYFFGASNQPSTVADFTLANCAVLFF